MNFWSVDWRFDEIIADLIYESSNLDVFCYDPSYAPMLVAMLMTMLVAMLMAMFMAIAGRSSLGYRIVPKPTLFRVSLCSSEPYR